MDLRFGILLLEPDRHRLALRGIGHHDAEHGLQHIAQSTWLGDGEAAHRWQLNVDPDLQLFGHLGGFLECLEHQRSGIDRIASLDQFFVCTTYQLGDLVKPPGRAARRLADPPDDRADLVGADPRIPRKVGRKQDCFEIVTKLEVDEQSDRLAQVRSGVQFGDIDRFDYDHPVHASRHSVRGCHPKNALDRTELPHRQAHLSAAEHQFLQQGLHPDDIELSQCDDRVDQRRLVHGDLGFAIEVFHRTVRMERRSDEVENHHRGIDRVETAADLVGFASDKRHRAGDLLVDRQVAFLLPLTRIEISAPAKQLAEGSGGCAHQLSALAAAPARGNSVEPEEVALGPADPGQPRLATPARHQSGGIEADLPSTHFREFFR